MRQGIYNGPIVKVKEDTFVDMILKCAIYEIENNPELVNEVMLQKK